jgi:Mn-dependent DtxR family transcriptional regulator
LDKERYLERIHEVMRDKYRLLDKFVVICAELDPAEIDRNVQIFEHGKKLRDEFSHGEFVDEDTLPLKDVQGLLRKFVRLHVERS